MEFATPPQRWFYKCRDCLAVSATEGRLAVRKFSTDYFDERAVCACGGKLEEMGQVNGGRLTVIHAECPCDCRCTSACGPSCECSCGGRNHGTNLLVDVVRDHGGIPTVTPRNIAQSKAIAGEYRDALEALLVLWRPYSEKRRSGWMPESEYREFVRLGDAVTRARAAKTHKGRMKIIAQAMCQNPTAR